MDRKSRSRSRDIPVLVTAAAVPALIVTRCTGDLGGEDAGEGAENAAGRPGTPA